MVEGAAFRRVGGRGVWREVCGIGDVDGLAVVGYLVAVAGDGVDVF